MVASELDRSIRSRQPVSLILLDIDHFKRFNDTYGHQAGDAVLCELVQVIGTAMRSVDTLFRWGGEEFVVLASSTGYRGGATLAEKVRSKVEQHRFAIVGGVTISLGVAEHVATESAEIWFRRVDEALYRAKNGGRNRVCVDQRGSSDLWAAKSGPSVIRLVWQEPYECGEPTIDREHRELFELANVLLDASFKSKSSPEAFSAALEKLLAAHCAPLRRRGGVARSTRLRIPQGAPAVPCRTARAGSGTESVRCGRQDHAGRSGGISGEHRGRPALVQGGPEILFLVQQRNRARERFGEVIIRP